ncbi:hypothetical protein HY546_02265 [archaeon]|nr:hypothetical protein [archaeon]
MKAQAGLEALITVGVVLVIVLFTYLFVIAPNADISADVRLRLGAELTCNKVADALTTAFYSGSGTSLFMSLPARLYDGSPFNVTVYPSHVRVDYSAQTVQSIFCHLQAASVRLETNSSPQLAYLVRESCLYDELLAHNPDVYCAKSYDNSCLTSDPCRNMSTEQRNVSYNSFLSKLAGGSYHVYVAEDPEFDSAGITLAQDYVSAGGTMLISEDIGAQGQLFGASFADDASSDTLNVTAASEVLPGVMEGNIIKVNDKTYDITGIGVTAIAQYSDGKTGLAKMEHGYGILFYFPDFNATVVGSGVIFEDALASGINALLEDRAAYDYAPFQLNGTAYKVYNREGTITLTRMD